VDTLISKLSWVNGDEQLMRFLHFNSKLFNMAEGESVDFDSDPTAGQPASALVSSISVGPLLK